MKILYFAWLRERLNRGEEEVSLPPGVATVGDLIDWLASRDEAAELAFAKRSLIKAAVDAKLVNHSAPIAGASVVALFPPMTGG
ncbi:molybdenum cofactor biosynthesis protein MoaD [Devosia epidermidihirudinis]|uniref:Molybdenum cofactor biosynthesis protein MoaD n=1 Tax=Devosia epidermidihirudinis TaxID=1293439 RepID=A0A0F5QB66_9HYPH|nr:molybdopterin converting factor subunit 1 [Devosia epidermidihirudinis]KKC37239.1 molybdenum cofactor biosynthesis protein MoaD [Devosia epidermidihirudinis]